MRRAPDHLRARTCNHCKRGYTAKPSRASTYCSRLCKAEAERSRPRPDPRPCAVCGATFAPSRARGDARFCSKACIWRSTKGSEFNRRIAVENAERIGAAQRGRGQGKAYRKLMGRHEHRVVAEQKLGRPLRAGEVVHHIDGDKLNNRPDNLEVITQGEHMQRHGIGVPGVTPAWKPWTKRKTRIAA